MVVECKTVKSSRKKRGTLSAPALTEEQVRAVIKRSKSFSPITEEDIAAIERVRQKCKGIIEATDFLFDSSDD
eukprot:scaffold1553_cov97-Skeletonema_marinoi.AAC.2